MSILFKMALRNIIRNARRNMFTILSIAFGLAFLFWIQCVLVGHDKNMIETITSTFTGDIQIHQKNFLDERLAQYSFKPSEKLTSDLNSLQIPWSPRVYFSGIISNGDLSFPVILVGIDPKSEPTITHLKHDVVSGAFLEAEPTCPEAPILVSERMAKKLVAEIGDKLVILGQDNNGALGSQLFRVKGFFGTSSRDFDKLYVFTTIPCAQLIGAVDGLHEIILKTGYHLGEDAQTRSKIDAFLDPELSTSTWKDIVLGVANLIRFNKALSSLIAFILFSVITLGVVNAVLMNIYERIREIGIMLAIGTTPFQIRIIILFEAFFIAVLGALIGTSLGVLAVLYHQHAGFDLTPFLGKGGVSGVGFSFPTTVYPVIEWTKYLQLVLAEIVFIVLAALYPAFRASRLKPTDTIRG